MIIMKLLLRVVNNQEEEVKIRNSANTLMYTMI